MECGVVRTLEPSLHAAWKLCGGEDCHFPLQSNTDSGIEPCVRNAKTI